MNKNDEGNVEHDRAEKLFFAIEASFRASALDDAAQVILKCTKIILQALENPIPTNLKNAIRACQTLVDVAACLHDAGKS
jgi:hypothetical protein